MVTKVGTSKRINHDSSEYYSSRMNKEESAVAATDSPGENSLPAVCKNAIILASSENMNQIPDSCVHLMITSPPYNVSKEYDEDLTLSEYLSLLRTVFGETYRVLVDGGRACVNVANVGRKPYIPLSDYISLLMKEIGFLMRGEIIWNKGAGAGTSMAWGSWCSATNPVLRDTHEYILVFSKGNYKREKKNNKTPIFGDHFMEWTKSIWNISPASAKRVGHPAPFPLEIPSRLIQLFSFESDVILDPFMGSGTTAIAAVEHDRIYVGFENEAKYIDIAEKRISPYKTAKELAP